MNINISVLLTLIIFSCSCMGQRIALSKSVSMSTQKKLRKADKKEVSSLVTNRLGKTEYLARSIAGNPDDVYITDDLVILVKSSPVKKESGILEKLKLAIDNCY